MTRTWRVGRFAEDVRIVHSQGDPLPAQAEPLSPEAASFRSADWFSDDASERRVLLEIHESLAGLCFADPERDLLTLRERVGHALRAGQLRAYRLPKPQPPSLSPGEKKEEERAPEQEKAWIEFVFEYPDGTPVKGLDYTLIHPGGSEEKGTLGADGLISREDVPRGTYVVMTKEVDDARWSAPRTVRGSPRARVDEEAQLTARVSGYPDGASATIKIFREHRETEAEIIKTLSATVKGSQIEATFQYDVSSSDERKEEEGLSIFVAEVSLDGGKRWTKTKQPLEIELHTISVPVWSSPYAEDGNEVELRAETLGYPDGTKVKVAVYEHDWDGDDKKVKDLPDAEIQRGKVVTICTYARPIDGAEAGEIEKDGEYFFELSIDEGAKRVARSALLWCSDVLVEG
ncbi:MAG: hypothetical protein ABI193_16475 [Minicystis sp.]